MTPDYQAIREEGTYDPVGTVRVSQEFGCVAVYIKIDDNQWNRTYIDPVRCQHLVTQSTISDTVAAIGKVVFVPKSVV